MPLEIGNSMNFCSSSVLNWPFGRITFASLERHKIREAIDTWLELQGAFMKHCMSVQSNVSWCCTSQDKWSVTAAVQLQEHTPCAPDHGVHSKIQEMGTALSQLCSCNTHLFTKAILAFYIRLKHSEDSHKYFFHLTVVEKASIDAKFHLLLQSCYFSSCIYITKRQLQIELCLRKIKVQA